MTMPQVIRTHSGYDDAAPYVVTDHNLVVIATADTYADAVAIRNRRTF